ncbi:MAG: T9SS type A sorting domain-containing protein [Bacteroidota bacterium]
MKIFYTPLKKIISTTMIVLAAIILTMVGKVQSQIIITVTNIDSVLCYGGNTGSIAVIAAGGTPPYTYVWNTNPPQTTATAINLPTGTYTVTVNDAGVNSATASATVYEPPILNVIVSNIDSVLCYGLCNGTATITASGGTPPYTYQWNTSPFQNTATAIGLCANVYTVTVTDANGCTGTAGTPIYEPSEMITAIDNNLDTLQCYGDDNGFITVNVVGGIAPWSFIWNTTPPQYSMTAHDLPAGTYTVTITDANDCTNTHSFTIYEPSNSPLSVQVDSINEECLNSCDGQATSAITGGVLPYTYEWSTGSTGLTITNLCPGIYSLTITDANGCTEFDNTTVGTSAIIDASFTAFPITGNIPLTIYFTYTGPYLTSNTFYWDFGDGDTSSLENPSHIYTIADTFHVLLIVADYVCIDTFGLFVYPGVPAFLPETGAGISNLVFLFPNPVTENLHLKTSSQIEKAEIRDITGRLLYTTTSKSINCSRFAKGIYFVKVETEKGVTIKKFVKE